MNKGIAILVFMGLVLSFCKCTTIQKPETQDRQSEERQFCISQEERRLYNLLSSYRKEMGLPPVSLSTSLSEVAKAHARDLSVNNPDKNNCNMHSWSRKGSWSSCCYTDDHSESECMWNKPSELTEYSGAGYEIVTKYYKSTGEQMEQNASNALNRWKKSPPHNNVILNKGIWEEVEWNAVGVGIYGGYATVWFGKEADPAGKPTVCNQ